MQCAAFIQCNQLINHEVFKLAMPYQIMLKRVLILLHHAISSVLHVTSIVAHNKRAAARAQTTSLQCNINTTQINQRDYSRDY